MCYVIPTLGAVITSAVWFSSRGTKWMWLNLLLWGGAIFGVIDHLFNGELFVVSDKWAADLTLGIVITVSICLFWVLVIAVMKPSGDLRTADKI